MMSLYRSILQHAGQHHGGAEQAIAAAANAHAAADLTTVSDDRYLATMTRCVFNAGFNWKVIEAKWPGFEAAFDGFDPARLAFFGDELLERLLSDERIVRNGQKIRATLENARFVSEVSRESNGFGRFLAGWPGDDQLGLMAVLDKKGARLGGATAQYFLRFSGWDAWIASPDVCRALMREGRLDKPEAKTKGALKTVQQAVNDCHEDSGQPRAVISRLLALSVG